MNQLLTGSKVFVTQENPNFNYTKAEEFGDLVFVTTGDISTNINSLLSQKVLNEISVKLDIFDPVCDYILLSGSPSVSAAVFLMLGNEGYRSLNLLKWSKMFNHYERLVIKNPKYI